MVAYCEFAFTLRINPVIIIESRGYVKIKKYLTISEFAGLRNVNINSIRYYEKQKILIPAWIDPQTKYRYYLPEQLNVLDAILLCIRLGISLKELKQFVDSEGQFDEKRILEQGKEILQRRLSSIQQGLEITQFNLDNMEDNQKYRYETEVYTRVIGERYLFETPFYGKWDDLVQKEKCVMELFHDAQRADMAPVFPPGILIRWNVRTLKFSLFVQILHPTEHDERIVKVPEAAFSCFQADLAHGTDIVKLLNEKVDMQGIKTVVISNMLLGKLHYSSRHSEIQLSQKSLLL